MYINASLNSSTSSSKDFEDPFGHPFFLKMDKLLVPILTRSSFRGGLLNFVSIVFKYREQKVRHSSAIYPSAIDPSGRALLRTYVFSVRRYLKVFNFIN